MNIWKKILSATLFVFMAAQISYAQPNSIQIAQYPTYIKLADSLYNAKEYIGSARAYEKAFKTIGGKGISHDRYNAARSWAMAFNNDSAFLQLFHIVEKAFYKDYNRVTMDADFESLHSDYRWERLLYLMKQSKEFNLGFERVSDFGGFPHPWFQWGSKDYVLTVDSTQRHSGKYSMLIEAPKDVEHNAFGCVACAIPADYEGKEIELEAYIKTKNMNMPVGLMIRIDSKIRNDIVAFDNMMQQDLQGTDEWRLYSVKLPIPKEAATFYIGAILSGRGKLWVDDFKVLIDGKDIKYAPARVVDSTADSLSKPRIQQLHDILSSKIFTINVEDSKGEGEYTFTKPDETWKMEYRYRLKNSDKPFKLVDEARIATNDFNALKRKLSISVRYYYNVPDPYYTYYKVSNGTEKVEFYTKYFDIWSLLRDNWMDNNHNLYYSPPTLHAKTLPNPNAGK